MKLTKIFLFILLAFFVGNIYSANADEVTGSVTVTVTGDNTPTATLTADATSVEYNTGTKLHISSTNASYCILSYPGKSNTQGPKWDINTGPLKEATTYTLVCGKNGVESSPATVTINVLNIPITPVVTVTADPLEYNVLPGATVKFTYTSKTTSKDGTACQLLDSEKNSKTPYQSTNPTSISYKIPNSVGNFGYYIQCRDKKATEVTAISSLIHVIAKSTIPDVEYTVTVSANAGGTVSPLGATKVKAGNDLIISYSLDANFEVQSIVVDGTKLGAYAPTIKVGNVNKDQTVVFTFTEKVVSVNLSANPAAMVLPDNSTTLKWETKGNPDSCTAGGDWSGAVSATGGTKPITYTKFGTYTYTITCKKVGKPDAKDSQKVEVRSIGVGLGINGPSTITIPESTTLQWVTNGNPTSCIASGDWNGPKNPASLFPHTETLKNLKAGKNTFNILCKKGTEEAMATVNLTVLADPNSKDMSGTLSATNCTLKAGASTCPIPYSWEVFNPEIVGGSAVTIPINKTIATGDKGSKTLNLAPGKTTLYLYNNGEELDQKEVEALIDPGICTWNGTVCVGIPAVMTGTLDATNCYLEAGKSTCPIPYSWRVINPVNVNGSAVTNNGTTLSKNKDVGNDSFDLAPGKTTLYLYNDGEPYLAKKEVEALIDTSVCTWNEATGICEGILEFVGEPSPVWSPWDPDSGVCLDIPKQTRYCYDENTNDKLDPGQCPIEDGLSNERITSYLICPAVTNMTVMNGANSIRIGNSNLTTLIRYNSNVKVSWSSVNSTTCSCSYFDSTSSGGCGSGTNGVFSASALKRDTTYTVICKDKYGLEGSDSVTVKIDKINAGYIEQ